MDSIEPNAIDYLAVASLPKQELTVQDYQQRDLAHLVESAGWKVLKEYIEGQLKLLDSINVGQGETVSQVGFKYLASKVARVQLESIISYVESNREPAEA